MFNHMKTCKYFGYEYGKITWNPLQCFIKEEYFPLIIPFYFRTQPCFSFLKYFGLQKKQQSRIEMNKDAQSCNCCEIIVSSSSYLNINRVCYFQELGSKAETTYLYRELHLGVMVYKTFFSA